MKKIIKEVIIITFCSLILTALYITALILLNDNPTIFDCIFPVWIFMMIPSYAFTINYVNSLSLEDGVRLGLIFGFGAIILPIIISPYLGFKYYKQRYKSYKLKKLYNRD